MATRRTSVAVSRVIVLLSLVGGAHTASAGRHDTQTVIEFRVHGNQTVSEDEIAAWAGIAVGDRAGADVVAAVEERLRATGRFDAVDVRRRYLSLTATDEIALIVVVRERAVPASANPLLRLAGELRRGALFLPLLDYTEGYGFTYGLQTSFVNVLGDRSRVSIPATWGGTKRIAVEADTRVTGGVVDRLQGGVRVLRRENPHFEIDAHRTELWLQADRALPGRLRVGMEAGWADVRFGALDDRLARYRLRLEVDTRADVAFPRNAVWAQVSYEWLDGSEGGHLIGRPRYQADVYKGLIGQLVLALRADYVDADAPVPPYEQPLLGGVATVRGWRVGAFAGDRRVNGSVELRVPLSSPLSVGRAGATLFYDTGATYDVGQSIQGARFRQGAGAGVFLVAPLVRLRLDVAHNLVDDVRVHVGAALSF